MRGGTSGGGRIQRLTVRQLWQDEAHYESIVGRGTQDAGTGGVLRPIESRLQFDDETRFFAIALDEMLVLSAA